MIPHDFVLSGPLADDVESVADGRERIWPLVEAVYARAWSGRPPTAREAQAALDSVGPCALGADDRQGHPGTGTT